MNAAYPMGNSHGGMVCVHGQWYIFDHRTTNGAKRNRQAVAEPIEIREDGTIRMVESTSCGLNGGPLKGTGTIRPTLPASCTMPECLVCATRWTDPRSPRMVRTMSRRSRGTGSDHRDRERGTKGVYFQNEEWQYCRLPIF